MPRGRKPSTLKQMTDTKVDGAYADLKAIPDDEFGGRLLQEDMIALERSRAASDTGVRYFSGIDKTIAIKVPRKAISIVSNIA